MSKLTTLLNTNTKLKGKITTSLKEVGCPINLNLGSSLTSEIKTNGKVRLTSDEKRGIPVDENIQLKSYSSGTIKDVDSLLVKVGDPNYDPVQLTFYKDEYIQGGYRVVSTLIERDNIHCCYRKKGMKVMVIGEDLSFREYVLQSGNCDENEWKEIVVNTDIDVDESEVELIEDYSTLGINLKSQKDLNIILKNLLLSLEDQIQNIEVPTNTSHLTNDGADGIHPFITSNDIPEIEVPTKTSDLINDGEDSIHPFITLQELPEGDKNYIHDQFTPSSIWKIYHPLNKKVNVLIADSAGTVVEGQVVVNSGDFVEVEFNFPFSGEAILN